MVLVGSDPLLDVPSVGVEDAFLLTHSGVRKGRATHRSWPPERPVGTLEPLRATSELDAQIEGSILTHTAVTPAIRERSPRRTEKRREAEPGSELWGAF
jgi:hypothetical protein